VGSLWPPGNGNNEMDPRFLSLFSTFNIEKPSDDIKKRIYSSILDAHIKQNEITDEIGSMVGKITDASMKIW
jgi:dynein heavy chain